MHLADKNQPNENPPPSQQKVLWCKTFPLNLLHLLNFGVIKWLRLNVSQQFPQITVEVNFTPVSKMWFFGIQDGDSSILEFILEIYSRKSHKSHSTLPVTTSTLSQTAKEIRNGIVEEFEKEGLLSVNSDKVFPINPMVIIIVNKTNLQNNAKLYRSTPREILSHWIQ